jgi:hypothetical protein
MEHENGAHDGPQTVVHSLIPLEDFKTILGIDDREDVLSRYCLITATYTIEHYCKRRLLLKRHFELIDYNGDLFLPLQEYPVRELLAVYTLGDFERTGDLLESDFYRIIPDLEEETGEEPVDTVYSLSLSPTLNHRRGFAAIKAIYRAGYTCGEVPPDLASACLELAAWNMARYRGRRIGMTGAIRGSGKDGEHLEASIPEQVRHILEPYQRRII